MRRSMVAILSLTLVATLALAGCNGGDGGGGGRAAAYLEGEQAAGAGHLPADEPGGVVEAGVVHAGDGGVAGEPGGELLGPGGLGAHAQGQGLQAAVQQVGAEGVQDRAGEGADLAQPGGPVLVAGDDAGDLLAFDVLTRLAESGEVGHAVRIGVRSAEAPPGIFDADVLVDGPQGLADVLAALAAAVSARA